MLLVRLQPVSTIFPYTTLFRSWMAVAKEAGMKYAVLTTKHVAGHCLWPSKHTDYTVAHSGNTKDVVGTFVNACRKYGIKPDRKSTRLNSSHVKISYAVFCLKKK